MVPADRVVEVRLPNAQSGVREPRPAHHREVLELALGGAVLGPVAVPVARLADRRPDDGHRLLEGSLAGHHAVVVGGVVLVAAQLRRCEGRENSVELPARDDARLGAAEGHLLIMIKLYVSH